MSAQALQGGTGETAADTSAPFTEVELSRVRDDFPILEQRVHDRPLVYLDSAASTQKPRSVIDAVSHLYAFDYANVHRGVYELSERATRAYESGRSAIARLIRAPDRREVVLVRGTTDAINLVASSFGRARVGAGDEVVITAMEHHSNIVPWQILCQERGATLRVVPMNERGELELDQLESMLNERTRIVSVVHISNALGTVNPVREIVERARVRGIPVLVDGAQAVARTPVDVAELGCDFYALSGHKLYGPSGIGALWSRMELLEEMPPYQGGGEMIATVTFEKTSYAPPPAKFEAGTPNIAGAAGLAAAVEYVEALGLERIAAHEDGLMRYAEERLAEIRGLRRIGTAAARAGAMSFVFDDIHAHDVGTVLDREGVAIRTGHHCAQPVMDFYGVAATARASFGVYNTRADIDALVGGLVRVRELFE
jgi:cysteine desulfurase/selenocysteine lyase